MTDKFTVIPGGKIGGGGGGGRGEGPLNGGVGGGTSDGMETRVKVLEYRSDQTEKTLARIEGKLDTLGRDVAEVKGKISATPSTWNIVTINAGLIALVIAVAVGTLSVLKSLGII